MRNARGIDLLVANATATRTASIQVKTNQDSGKAWMLDAKSEQLIADNLFYVFVNLNGRAAPSFHIVESAIVAEHITRTHREWLTGMKRDGTARKDTIIRQFDDGANRCLDAWDRLGLEIGVGAS